ncbi:hypothetical protein Vafri_7196 [Volvox africanus]|nr:hypothetical protein Vafri_7196 [Volvox africanus]
MNKLSLQLAEAQRKLVDLEQAAFSRTLVQAWLETATPQRCASVDRNPASSKACSADLEERKPHTDLAVDVIEAIDSASRPPALSGEDYGLDQEGSASHVAVDVATVGRQPDVPPHPHGTFGLLDAGSGEEIDLRGWDGAVIVRRSGWAISPDVRVRSGPSPPVSSGGQAMPLQVPTLLPGHGGCQALPCVKSPPRDCTFLPASKLHGTHTPGGAGWRSADLAPTWSLSLQDEKRWPPLPLPPTLVADSPSEPAVQSPGRGHQMPPGVDSSPPAANAVSAHTLTAASIWMPSGAALCHSWGFEPPNCGIQPSPSLLSAIPGGGEPVAQSPNGPLLQAYSAPDERIHHQQQQHHHHHHHHHHPEYCQHGQVRSDPRRMWPPSSLRITERSPRLGGSSAISLYSPSGPGGYYGGTRAAVSSFSSAPLDAHQYLHQDGGEWCNIPLGSPVGTPKNGTVFDGNI